jgi:hypothetical protein
MAKLAIGSPLAGEEENGAGENYLQVSISFSSSVLLFGSRRMQRKSFLQLAKRDVESVFKFSKDTFTEPVFAYH